jgi:uncharacterized repeat protein (TIGR02543 family)
MGSNGGTSANCSASKTTFGAYSITFATDGNGTLSGTAAQTIYAGKPSSQVTATPNSGYTFLNWTGSNGFIASSANPLIISSVTASWTITANFTAIPIQGVCGSANNSTVTIAPTTNLCTTGTLIPVTGSGPWSWSCNGSNGGTSTTCSASKTTIGAKAGDCDNSGTVTIAEVQSAINMFLGLKTVEACVNQDGVGGVSIAEVQKVINSFLGL